MAVSEHEPNWLVRRRQGLAVWEPQLRRMMNDMELANGDRPDDIEALIRIAWKLVAAEAKRTNARDAL